MSRSQYISHDLVIKGFFSPIDLAVLSFINTRPQYCLENLQTIAAAIHRSSRTVQRAVERLVSKGIVKRRYTTFKRMVLTIVSMDEQKKLAKTGVIASVLKYCAFKKKKRNAVYDMTKVSGLNTTPVSEPISRSKENKSIIPNRLKSIGNRDFNLQKEKNRQIEAMLAYMNNK